MDLLLIFKSVNKIAIIAFLITFIAIIYEIYLLVNEKNQSAKPIIPDFRGSNKIPSVKVARLQSKHENIILSRPNKRLIIILFIILITFGIIYAMGFILKVSDLELTNTTSGEKTTVKIISSSGIKLYNMQWKELDGVEIGSIKSGDLIYITLANVQGGDIDKARIRVNNDGWVSNDETILFDKQKNIFYRQYKVASTESVLKIEAQLHSKEDGWLGQ
ncbi:hypothetical protein A3C23_03105 [Candidatus Roizmanbacteria bacterium RIFCSPHIGHO2_02_FULL_37_13b]|uniref:Uncharacterized protein n=1 Tax=Candidatus Roizmanbacteria bacterium RIFCSPLOWO2_02_FULL_36_11 TaxID=1802071 RepID=A0A1F7JIA5_9BACT|nr:MAG: hypothetical protein A3C23_03105 [Candidatus Roizmanbacteria bacterium RIFCSPHIGHO2_02_FULL_37_13b]OGK55339.1 MAG: hypothetical protein A3H78_04540 [Candidatus Roizmanbacteria bacterium RIFCSPLOWO2_02_FULL_36_11]